MHLYHVFCGCRVENKMYKIFLAHVYEAFKSLISSQSYHEEMLQRSSRRKLFNDYAKQTMRRYPALKEEISVRLARLNTQWAALEAAMSPWQQTHDEATMLKGKGCGYSGPDGRVINLSAHT